MRERTVDAVIRRVSDGDFETTMRSVGYSLTPRERITAKMMKDSYDVCVFLGLESEIYGEVENGD